MIWNRKYYIYLILYYYTHFINTQINLLYSLQPLLKYMDEYFDAEANNKKKEM